MVSNEAHLASTLLASGRTTPRLSLCSIVWLALSLVAQSQPSVVGRVAISGTARPLQLETKAGTPLQRDRVARDVKRLWATGWFDDIRVLSKPSLQGATLEFHFTERPRYHLRKVHFEPRHFDLPPLPVGTLIDKVSVERLTRSFQERLRNSGYRDAIVSFAISPVGVHQADVLFRVSQGERSVVDELQVSGISPEDSRHVAKVLRVAQPRKLLPGIPGIWKGWKLRPALDQQALELALQNLRSNYISQGYLNATTNTTSTVLDKNRFSLSIRVSPGGLYKLEDLGSSKGLTPASRNVPPMPIAMKELCHCLIEQRAQAERRGIADFETQLFVRSSERPSETGTPQGVSLSARIETGPAYRVGRIEFRGNHHLSDLTLRRALVLSEGELFDRDRLRRSLTRLNATGLIHPVTEDDVEAQRDPTEKMVDLLISVREKDRGRWQLGAPAWPGVTSSSTFSIGTRLPNWGPSFLELPTYFIALNLRSPLPGLPLSIFNRTYFSISLARPYLPGEEWRSGFQISPQASWIQSLLASGLLQVSSRLAESPASPPLPVPVRWETASSDELPTPTTGILVCNSQRQHHARLLNAFRIGTEWLFAAGL